MKSFLKMTLAVIVGLILTGILFFVIMLSVISGIAAAGNKPAEVAEKSVLVLKTGTAIPDRTNSNPLSMLDPFSLTFTPEAGLNDILKNLRKAASDEKISGILIENGLMPSGWATADELRIALKEFKQSGKFIYSYSDYVLMQESYFVSTAADNIWLNPTSMFDFKGLAAEVTFYKDALEKLGVEVQVIRHGKFKGAVEPYILDKLSDENRLQISKYVGSIWEYAVKAISESRGVPVERVMQLADSLSGYNAALMTDNGLIDGTIYRDQLEDSIRSAAGIEEGKKINYVSMTKYSKVPEKHSGGLAKSKIAVIYAEGSIVMGEGDETNIGGNRYASVLREVRNDTAIKAVVFRVNSRGGDAIASDMIWREVELISKVKPVVVSMGNYAASGGYYISAAADKILASPVTVTGSIGVFGLIPNAQTLLDKKLGISSDVVKTNSHSDFPSIMRPLSAFEKEVLQANVERTYSTFTGVVAAGRGMSQANVDSLGQGHVWSGTDAAGAGLVDGFGGLNDAIREAASLAKLETYRLVERPAAVDIYSRLLKEMSGEVREKIVTRELGEAAKYNYTDGKVIGYIQPQGLKEHAAHSRPQGNASGVDLGSGAFRGLSSLDLSLKGRGPSLSFGHYYNSFNFYTYPNKYPMGPGWSHNLESNIIEDDSGNVYVNWPDGTVSAFTKTGPGISDYHDESGAHDLMKLDNNDGVNYGYTITKKNQTTYTYRRLNINPVPGQTNFLGEYGQDTMIVLFYIEDWAGNKLSFDRETAYATLQRVYDNFGREFRFTYDDSLQFSLQKVDEVIGGVTKRSISFTYYDNGNLATFTDAKGNVTRYGYDADNQLSSVTYPTGNTGTVVYESGKTVSVTEGSNAPTLINYEPTSDTTIITTVTDPRGNVFRNVLFDFKLISQQGPDMNPATFVYADTNNPNQPTHVADKEGNTTDFQYDPIGNLTKITNASGKVALFTYNSKNNLKSKTDFHTLGDSTIVPTIYGYDLTNENKLVSITTPEIETTSLHYNSNNQVDWIQNPLGYTTSFQYDIYGNLSKTTGPENNITQFDNDYAGRTYRVVDADLKETNYIYDANDNLNIIKDHTLHQVALDPDANDNLHKVSWLNNGQLSETSYFYDPQDRLRQVNNPLALISGFTYDPFGSLKTRTDFNGATISYDYDPNNRLQFITYPSHMVTIVRNRNGGITSLSSPSGASSFTYNALNLVKSYTDPYGKVVQYDYNDAGRLWHLTYPGGQVVTYGYDRDGRLKTVQGDWIGGTTTYIYDAAGNLKEIQRPNGTRAVYTYDRASRLKGITETTSGGSVICSYSHVLSAAGNIQDTTMTEPLAGIPPSSATTLTYDRANRLQSAGSTAFTYNNNGNRTGKTASGQTTIFQWDYENMLTSIAAPGKTVQHLYDGMNNRIARVVNGTATRYVLDVSGEMSQVLAETDGGGNIQAYYVYGIGLVSRITPAGTRQFYHYDHRGDTIALTDSSGNITDSYAYDPYGKLLASQGTTANPFKFVGQYGVMDDGDDLYFMRARFYDGGYGRFLSEDPSGFAGEDWNLYSYVNQQVLGRIDPSGLKGEKPKPRKRTSERTLRIIRSEQHMNDALYYDQEAFLQEQIARTWENAIDAWTSLTGPTKVVKDGITIVLDIKKKDYADATITFVGLAWFGAGKVAGNGVKAYPIQEQESIKNSVNVVFKSLPMVWGTAWKLSK